MGISAAVNVAPIGGTVVNKAVNESQREPLSLIKQMTHQIEKRYPKKVLNKFRTIEDKEVELEMHKID